MATQISRRKGTSAEIAGFKGVMGEITVNETKRALHVHDGVTLGGNRTLMESELGAVSGVASLGADQILSNGQLPGRLQSNPVLVTDIDAISAAGWYRHAVGAAGQPIAAAGIVEHLKSDTRAIQNWYQLGATVRYTRFHDGVSWSAWTLISITATYDIKVVVDRAALKALDPTMITVAYLNEDFRQGLFTWTPGDMSGFVAADTQEGLYIKATSVAATLGAWVRVLDQCRLNVKWFGAVGDWNGSTGTINNAAFQAALTLAANFPYGMPIFIPAGRYRLTTQLTFSGAPLSLKGDGLDNTQLVWTAAGGIKANMVTPPNFEIGQRTQISDFNLHVSGVNNAGVALEVVYSSPRVSVSQEGYIKRVKITQANGYWTKGIRTTNFGECHISENYIMMFLPTSGGSSDVALECISTNDSPTYGLRIVGNDINGAKKGVNVFGTYESVYINKNSVVGSKQCVVADSSDSVAGSPALHITDNHLNGMKNSILTNRWRSVYLTGNDIYAGVVQQAQDPGGAFDENGDLIQINNGKWFHATNNKVESGRLDLTKRGYNLNNCEAVTITGGTIINVTSNAIIMNGSPARDLSVSGAVIQGNGTSEALYFSVAVTGVAITGNVIRNFVKGVVFTAASEAIITGNMFKSLGADGINASNAAVVAKVNNFVSVPNPYVGAFTHD